MEAMSRHHRKPRSKGGSDDPSNISWVSTKQHQAWRTLFGNKDAHTIAQLINELWLPGDTYFAVRRKKAPPIRQRFFLRRAA
jgi:hypothetical protein